MAAHQRARNRHGVRTGYDMAPLAPSTPLSSRNPPAWFSHSFLDMSDLGGDLARDNYGEYERHLDAIVEATLDAWLSRNVANGGEKW